LRGEEYLLLAFFTDISSLRDLAKSLPGLEKIPAGIQA
jgi:hypothetical protein